MANTYNYNAIYDQLAEGCSGLVPPQIFSDMRVTVTLMQILQSYGTQYYRDGSKLMRLSNLDNTINAMAACMDISPTDKQEFEAIKEYAESIDAYIIAHQYALFPPLDTPGTLVTEPHIHGKDKAETMLNTITEALRIEEALSAPAQNEEHTLANCLKDGIVRKSLLDIVAEYTSNLANPDASTSPLFPNSIINFTRVLQLYLIDRGDPDIIPLSQEYATKVVRHVTSHYDEFMEPQGSLEHSAMRFYTKEKGKKFADTLDIAGLYSTRGYANTLDYRELMKPRENEKG